MHCNHCGCLLQSSDQFCPGCGRAVAPAPLPASPAQTVAPPMYVVAGQPSGKATASLICGIFFFIFPAAIIAIVMGHMALYEIKRSSGRLIGEGRAIAGLVLGYMGIAGIPFLLIIAAIAIPNLLRARMAANEASAVGSVRTINTAEMSYASAFPKIGYTCDLRSLGGDSSKSPVSDPSAPGLIDNMLASGAKSGYRFNIVGCGAVDDAPRFQVTAEPITPGTSGQRTFCSDQTGVIRYIQKGSGEDCLQFGDPIR
jgi:type IV pilus assembly protein PilA